ncbi:MAG: UxaA family hydrolase [Candidatus Saccharibacteria bacterium]|nr:UxaA family hydrolase [Rhodoferax sp.]
MGFARQDGRVGVRNHLAVISTVALSNRIAELAAQRHEADKGEPVLQIKGEFQRGLQLVDAQLQDQVIAQLVDHPNIGAALVLCHDRRAAQAWQKLFSDKPVEVLAVMDGAGVENAIQLACQALERLSQMIRGQLRVPCPFSALTFALECGGSDASSAVCSNPAVGRFVDFAIAHDARVIVSETAEFIGGEEVVRAQSVSPEIAQSIINCIAITEARMAGDGDHYRGVNPTAENIEAGLTTLVEKTMGAVCKIGDARFEGCLSFGQSPRRPGLYFMDTPFFSPCSITGMLAAGAQITLFSMGVFNPSGNPLAPTIKLCGNPRTIENWSDGIDVNLSPLITGEISLEEAGNQVTHSVMEAANGVHTKTEKWGEGQFIIPQQLPAF